MEDLKLFTLHCTLVKNAFENYDKLPPKQHDLARCFGGSLLFIQL